MFTHFGALPDALAVRLVTLAGPHSSPSGSPTAAATGSPSVLPSPVPGVPTTVVVQTTDSNSGLGDFGAAQIVTLTAALIAVSGVIVTLLFNAAKSRRDALATLYADALGAVAAYLEGPYRILRKDGENATRFAITSKLSDVKTSIDHNQALLRLHARDGVADAYDAFVMAAKVEAGKQMQTAWEAPPVTTDEGVNLRVALPRGDSEAARDRLLAVMQADLSRRWYSRSSKERYDEAVQAVADATPALPPAGDSQPGPTPDPDPA
jgi:hypothetical protein